MIEIIDRDTKVVLAKGPTLMVPHKGDIFVLRDIQYIVNELVYEVVPVRGSLDGMMILRIYVIRILT